VEGLGNIDGFLAEGAVGHEEYFVGLDGGAEAFHFLDEILIDLETAGGVEDDAVGVLLLGGGEAGGADGRDILGDAVGVKAELFLLRENFKLVDGGGAVNVAPDDEGAIAALFEHAAEFGGGGGFARSVQTDHHDLEWAGGRQLGFPLAEELHELVVDDLDDLLAGGDTLEDFLSVAGLLHAVDELARDLEVDICRQQRRAHLLEGVGHVFFGELADTAQVAQGRGEFVGE